MPLPKPRSGESRDDFTSRCMSESDLPLANDQRLAACMQAWRDRSKDSASSSLDFIRSGSDDE